MGEQTNQKEEALRVLAMLEGKWMGEGQGDFPTIDSFDYQETLTFERRDKTSLFYQQRTEKRYQGETSYLTSHWESGFWRALDNGTIEVVNSQSGGRSEVLIGIIQTGGPPITLKFRSRILSNDERMVASGRTFEIEPDSLKYWMGMQTNRVESIRPHLEARLRRVV